MSAQQVSDASETVQSLAVSGNVIAIGAYAVQLVVIGLQVPLGK